MAGGLPRAQSTYLTLRHVNRTNNYAHHTKHNAAFDKHAIVFEPSLLTEKSLCAFPSPSDNCDAV